MYIYHFIISFSLLITCFRSSVAEHLFVKQAVLGSIPVATKYF